ncbi:hypothetical protein [Candidatus Poriferisocius sp.]|uniref:hypothetical protein n=1 Tax=Candidatus Poriferisocius sp. TaxID=3101276 RepID=UPI003B5940D1
MTRTRGALATRALLGLLLVAILALGLVISSSDTAPLLAHRQTSTVDLDGMGRCPASVQQCVETWTHINYWTHYTTHVPDHCTIDIIGLCGMEVIAEPATSSCYSRNNCHHGPHDSTPRPTGEGTWTVWNGHSNTNYQWSGKVTTEVEHEHTCPPGQVPGNFGICLRPCPDGTYVIPPNNCPTPDPSPDPSPSPSPEPTTAPTADPTPSPTSGPVVPPTRPNPCYHCTRPTNPVPDPDPEPIDKQCTTTWGDATHREVLSRLRWESVVPYAADFTDYHHPEVPGGRLFLTAASSSAGPARHWTARQPGTSLDVQDNSDDQCLWEATEVGVSLRQLLPYQAADLATLRSAFDTAAADAAAQAAALWDRLSSQRRQWYRTAFPRVDPATVWCAPDDLPPWTEPTDEVLSLSADWQRRHGDCRWTIPRRGLWEWELQVRYTSEAGDRHTAVVAADLSWFREPTGYLGPQVTLW